MNDQQQPNTIVSPNSVPATPTPPPSQPVRQPSSDASPALPTDQAQLQPQPPAVSQTEQLTAQPYQESQYSQPAPETMAQLASEDAAAVYAGQAVPGDGMVPDAAAITWQLTEAEGGAKNSTWYGAVTLAAILAAIATFFVTGRDFFAAGAVLIGILALAYLASRKPVSQSYALDDQGVYVGNRLRPYEQFRNFAIDHTGHYLNLVFTPLKRFAPPLVISVPADHEDVVIDTLSLYLPMDEHKPDMVDSLTRRMKL